MKEVENIEYSSIFTRVVTNDKREINLGYDPLL
jgi:hypothetical protein